ncbi:hypothetical protein VB713_05770 [Anabaena cylindrica UHCC 0172]|uniref:hypothetical protein n=1 Tax=Anabaena cylindrica TaxID=1165 RepID=UPI002B208FB6|nr:hypothetical protein [Anabaena cylindrica]MEA5550489.1 hypothetical protein [Anabaena cylindrica UHCC 0172]
MNYPRYILKQLILILSTILTPSYLLINSLPSYGAEDPSIAIVVKPKGDNLYIRQGTNRKVKSVRQGERNILESYNDILYVPGDKSSQASFAFVVGQIWEYAGLLISTIPSPMSSEYRFPCRAKGGFTIAWRSQGENQDRACNQGITVGPNKDSHSIFPLIKPFNLGQNLKNLLKAQADDEVVAVPGIGATTIQTRNTGNGIVIDVLAGDILAKSARNPGGRRIKAGERYAYPQDTITPIDTNDIARSPEMQDFLNPNNWSSPNISERVSNSIGYQIASDRAALGLPTESIASNSSNFLKVVSGSGRIIRSDYPAVVPTGIGVSQVTGGYDSSTQKITLEIEGRQAEISLNSLLVDGVPISFTVTKIIPRTYAPNSSRMIGEQFTHLVKDALIKVGIQSQGTLMKQGNKIQGKFTSQSRWVFDRVGALAKTGSVDGEFFLTLQVGFGSDIPVIREYTPGKWYDVIPAI